MATDVKPNAFARFGNDLQFGCPLIPLQGAPPVAAVGYCADGGFRFRLRLVAASTLGN